MPIFPSLRTKSPKQSNHDLSRKVRTTMAPGVLYPLLVEPVVSGDQIKISVESLIKTYPLLAPLMGSFKLQCDFFYAPLSLYNQKLHHNSDLTREPSSDYPNTQVPDKLFPYFTVLSSTPSDPASKHSVAPDSLLRFLGFPYGFNDHSNPSTTAGSRGTQRYNAIPLLMYLDTVRSYYANVQEDAIPVVAQVASGGISKGAISRVSLDDLFSSALEGNIGGEFMNPNENTINSEFIDTMDKRLGGLFLRCYLPDSKNVVLSNSLASAVGNAASVSTAGNSFTVDQFNLASKLYKVYSLSQLAGNKFSEWLRAQYSVKPDMRIDMPTFIGSTSTEVVFDDVVSSSDVQVGDTSQPLGTLGGRGKGYGDGKMHYFTATQPGYVMAIVSLIPRVDYQEFMHRHLLDLQLSDLFVNGLNGLGLQDFLKLDVAAVVPPSMGTWGGVDNPFVTSFGKQPAWLNLMTAVNEVFGDFSSTLRGWTLLRTYGNTVYSMPTAYIDPSLYNYAFADTSPLSQNFLSQFAFTLYKRSNVSKRMMPTI